MTLFPISPVSGGANDWSRLKMVQDFFLAAALHPFRTGAQDGVGQVLIGGNDCQNRRLERRPGAWVGNNYYAFAWCSFAGCTISRLAS
jgi:hypothetical protein